MIVNPMVIQLFVAVSGLECKRLAGKFATTVDEGPNEARVQPKVDEATARSKHARDFG